MSKDDTLPMLPWFPRDFIASTRAMSVAERGAYRELLDFQWEMGRLPADHERLARLLGCSVAEFEQWWPAIEGKFVRSGNQIFNKRMEEHRRKALSLKDIRAETGRKGGLARASRFASSKHEANAIAIASDLPLAKIKHPSPSPSPEKDINPKDSKDRDAPNESALWSRSDVRSVQCPACNAAPADPCIGTRGDRREANHRERIQSYLAQRGVNPVAWETWIEYRRKIGRPLKPASFQKAAAALAAFGDAATQAAVIDQSIGNGWQGLFPLKAQMNGNGHATSTYIAPLTVEQLEECERLGITPQQYRQEHGLAQPRST